MNATRQRQLGRREVLIAGAVVLAVAGLGAGAWQLFPGSSTSSPTPPRPSLDVVSFRVAHFRNLSDGRAPRGGIGETSFETFFDDDVRISLELSELGYCYVIAYNPDGGEQLCYPEDAELAPPRIKTVHYPEEEVSGFGLSDGIGLQAFVVVASRDALPAYSQWRARAAEVPWSRTTASNW